jgi:mannose-1-phosphate guanylyltransferase
MPKQFVKLFQDNEKSKSLFQLTVERNSKVCDKNFIVSNAEQYFLAQDQLEELTTNDSPLTTDYLLEPIGRNTAPAITLACMALDSEEIVLVTPSDHLIKNETEYKKVVKKAKELAFENNLVTFGITPTFAETGFGYIEAEASSVKCVALSVKKFHEKPDLKTAQEYIKQNNLNAEHLALSTYYWNSGMFMFKAGVFLEELQKYAPDIYESCVIAFENKKIQNSTLRIQHSHMEAIPSESIDYAVMEKSNKVKVIPSNIAWSDVGSFDSLIQECKSLDAQCYEEDCKDNFYYSDDAKKIIATIGLKDFIVVDTPDALFIAQKGETQKVKNIVEKIRKSTSHLVLDTHTTGYRPWGSYTVLEDSTGYKIKRIEVKPNKRLSLQKHKYRNEHWIVLSGIATVEIEKQTFLLNTNESTYIKAGQIHRLSNNTNEPLVIIEVQVGSYTEEDDIQRLEDDFKREN